MSDQDLTNGRRQAGIIPVKDEFPARSAAPAEHSFPPSKKVTCTRWTRAACRLKALFRFLEEKVGPRSFVLFIQSLKCIRIENRCASLSIPTKENLSLLKDLRRGAYAV